MIKRQEVIDGLRDGSLTLRLSEWGDGMRGVGLYRTDNDGVPIERIAVAPWHEDHGKNEMVYADKVDSPNWYYQVFDAGDLSNQARALLVDHCKANETAILAWCDGDEDAMLPDLEVTNA